MKVHAQTLDPLILERNLAQLAQETAGRERRIAIRLRCARAREFGAGLVAATRVPLWWIAPASWAVVLGLAYVLSDWISELVVGLLPPTGV